MTCNNVMIDLETLSTLGDAAVIQIAARAFDPETDEMGAAFCEFVSKPVGHIDPLTVAWWLQNPSAAAIGAGMSNGVPTGAACLGLCQWFAGLGVEVVQVWCHGGIDFPWLEYAFAKSGCGRLPWSYNLHRDTRTVYAVAPGGMPDVPPDPDHAHDARYDCVRQITQLRGALRSLRAQAAHAESFVALETEALGTA